MSEIDFIHEPAKARYQALQDCVVVGTLEYELGDEVINFVHTYVPPEFGGCGIAADLVRYALDDVRNTQGLSVIPTCPYVQAWMNRHLEYLDLL